MQNPNWWMSNIIKFGLKFLAINRGELKIRSERKEGRNFGKKIWEKKKKAERKKEREKLGVSSKIRVRKVILSIPTIRFKVLVREILCKNFRSIQRSIERNQGEELLPLSNFWVK